MSRYNTPFVPPKPVTETDFKFLPTSIPLSLYPKLWPNSPPVITSAPNIYLLNENGQFEESSLVFSNDVAGKLASGRFFTRDPDGFLRQLQLENTENGTELSVSRPVKPEVPEAPSFWTRVRAVFGHKASKAKVQTYNEAKKFHTACRNLSANNGNEINLNPTEAEYQEETLAPDVRQKTTLQRETKLNKVMDNTDFHVRLHRDREFSRKEYDAVFQKKDVTAQDIKDAFIKLLKAQIVWRLHSIDNLNKDYAQHTYLILTNNIENYLNQYYIDAVNDYVAQVKTGDQEAIANARNNIFDAERMMSVDELIEFRRPPSWDNDHYFESITAQMQNSNVKRSAYQKMLIREEYLEKQDKLAHFEENLTAASQFSTWDMQVVMNGKDPNFATYMRGLEKLMTAQVAKMLLESTEIKDIKATMPIYDALTKNIWEFVTSEYRQDVHNIMNTLEAEERQEASKQSDELINKVVTTGMGRLLKKINKADPHNKHIQELNNQLKKPSAENVQNSMMK